MTTLKHYFLPLALLAAPLAVHADEWDNGARRYQQAPREVFWDGNCRVEQRINRDGEVVERRNCRGDGTAYARAARDNIDEPQPRRQPEERRYAELVSQPGSYAAYRNPARAEPAPALVDHQSEPVALAPPVVPKIVPKVVPAPLAVTTRVVAQVAPAVSVRRVVASAPAATFKTRTIARPVQAAPAVRVIAKAAPAVPPRLVAKMQPAAKPARLMVKAEPVVAAPVALAPRAVAKLEPAAVAPHVVAKVAPVLEAPRVAAKTQAVVKSPSNYPKSDWLVTLPATDGEKAEAVVKAPLTGAKAATPGKALVAKVEPDWQRHEYREYVVEKSKDRYSNLK